MLRGRETLRVSIEALEVVRQKLESLRRMQGVPGLSESMTGLIDAVDLVHTLMFGELVLVQSGDQPEEIYQTASTEVPQPSAN